MPRSKAPDTTPTHTGKKNDTVPATNGTHQGALSYRSAKSGVNTADQVTQGISEIYSKIGSGQFEIDPSRQAGLMLNAIGKKLQLESLRLRMGVHRRKNTSKPHFFLSTDDEKSA